MPKIFEYFGLIFFFYANEHLSIHVHISYAEYESKIEIEYENGKLKTLKATEVKARKPVSDKHLKEAIKFVEEYHERIVEKWTAFFVKNTKVSCEIINERI